MKKQLIIFLLFLTALLAAEPAYLKYNQAFGMKASNIAGYGIFYGFKPLPDLRLQASGIYYLFDSELGDKRHKITNYTIGLELQKDIVQQDNFRVYVMGGGYYYYDHDEEVDEDPFLVNNNSYNYGVGIGYEYFFRRVTLGAEIGYKLYNDHLNSSRNNIEQPQELIKETKLGAGITIGFIF